MTIHWDDLWERFKEVMLEFKGQTIGMVGLGIIIMMVLLGIFAPVIAPDTNGEWASIERWKDNPRSAAPLWVDYILTGDRARHVITHDIEAKEPTKIREDMYVHEFYINYTMDYDYPPTDIILDLQGSMEPVDYKPTFMVEVIRPNASEGQIPRLIDEKVNGSNDVFENRFYLGRNVDVRDKIYNWALQYEDSNVSKENINPVETIFAKANGDILSDPEPHKDKYQIKVTVIGNQIEMNDNARAIFSGRVYGLMGTDNDGHSISKGWVWGARYALIIGGSIALLTVTIGTVYGMTSAYFGGWVDELMQRINEIILGINTFILVILIMYLWKKSMWVFVAVYGAFTWRGIAKIIRSRGLQIRQDTYIEAAESLGSSGGRIIRKHMIPQIMPYSVAEAALMVPLFIMTEAGLSVLGLGDPNIVTWGRLLSEAREPAMAGGLWWWVLLPGLGLILMGFAFIASGMAIEKVVNPKMRQR